MKFGSVCSGIEAASVAFTPLGWTAAWFSEIEPFPCAVLAHHYPLVPNLGDMRALPALIRAGLVDAPDLLCGGTPCQAFSVAGLRQSLADDRGNLSLIFCEIANAIDERRATPAVILWENVPGVLSTADNAFGCFLAGLAGEDTPLQPAGAKWSNAGVVYGPRRTVAWRTLDAQYFGLAQRRRRVFVVASAGGIDPASVLFEFDGVRRDTAPSREAREDVAATLDARAQGGGFPGTDGACGGHVVADTLRGHPRPGSNTVGAVTVFAPEVARCVATREGNSLDWESTTMVAHSLRGEGFDASEDGTGRGTPLVPVCFDTTQITSAANRSNPQPGDPCHPLTAGGDPPAIAFDARQDCVSSTELFGALQGMQVRRLTPRECERLQGFPDDYTLVPHRGKPAADGPRYKALGNSWAVPVVRWIGARIAAQLT